MQKKYDKYEDEISIFSLIWYWVSRWKSIVAIALIGLILGCGFAVVKAPGATSFGPDKSEQSLELQITEDLKQFCEDRMSGFQQYVDNSGILAIDAFNLYRGAITYKVAAPGESIGAIYGAVYAYLYNGELYSEMAEQTGLYSAVDFSSIIGCSTFGVNDAVIVDSETSGEMTFAITILGKTEEEALLLKTQLEKSFDAYINQLKDDYTITDNRVVASSVTPGTSSGLAETQDAIRTKFTAEKEMRNNYNSVLSSLQSQVGSDDTVETTLSKTTILTYGAIGLAVAFILAIFVWGLIYLFGDKLYAVEKIEEKFAMKSLGTIHDTKKLNPIDRFIAQKRGSVYCSLPVEEQRNVVLLNIKNELKKIDAVQKVYLVSSLGEKLAEAAGLKEGLEAAGYTVQNCANVIGRTDILEQMKETDAVVVLENKDLSKVSLVEAELAVLKEYVGNVLGLVVIGGKK